MKFSNCQRLNFGTPSRAASFLIPQYGSTVIWIPYSCLTSLVQRFGGLYDIEVDDKFWYEKKWPQIMQQTQGRFMDSRGLLIVPDLPPPRTLRDIIAEMKAWEESGHHRNGDRVRAWWKELERIAP